MDLDDFGAAMAPRGWPCAGMLTEYQGCGGVQRRTTVLLREQASRRLCWTRAMRRPASTVNCVLRPNYQKFWFRESTRIDRGQDNLVSEASQDSGFILA